MTATKHVTMRGHVDNCHARARSMPQESGWYARHAAAWNAPKAGMESAIVEGIKSWLAYADAMSVAHEYQVGEDGYCGPYWESWGLALRGLLSGPVGDRLDLGTLDSIIWGALTLQGFGDAETAGR